MSIPVRIPTPLRKLTQNQEIVEVDGVTIRDVIENLEKTYPDLKERICDEENNIRRFVNVFVNDEDIRFLQDAATQVKPGDEARIVPAIDGVERDFAVHGSPFAVPGLRSPRRGGFTIDR